MNLDFRKLPTGLGIFLFGMNLIEESVKAFQRGLSGVSSRCGYTA